MGDAELSWSAKPIRQGQASRGDYPRFHLAFPVTDLTAARRFYGGALGAIAGVLIADYWVMRNTVLKLGDLYRTNGIYRYAAGFNWRGLVSLLIGGILAVGGAYSTPGNGPFPAKGIISPLYSGFPFHVYDYSWVVGLVAAFLCYLALSALFPAGQVAHRTVEAAPAT